MCLEISNIKKKFENDIQIVLQKLIDHFKLFSNERSIQNIINDTIIYKNKKQLKLKHIAYIKGKFPIYIITPILSIDINIIKKYIKKKNFGTSNASILFGENNIKISILKKTYEKRLDIIKNIKKIGEKYKIHIRNIRRHFNVCVKKYVKTKKISKDLEKKYNDFSNTKTFSVINKMDHILLCEENNIKNM